MAYISTTNMGLKKPVASTSSYIGTNAHDWAGFVNFNIFCSDSHNHTSNNGVQISSSDLTISNWDVGNFSLYDLTYVGLSTVTDLSSIPDCSIFVYGGNLWFKDGSSNDVQITDGNALVSVSTTAGFYGDYTTSSAAAVYYTDSDSFYFYNNDSASLADIHCSGLYTGLFGSSSLTVEDLTYSVINPTTIAGYFPTAINSCPDPTTGGWQNCFYSENQSAFSYPYVVRTDSSGGVPLPNVSGNIPFYGDSGYSSYNYANDTSSGSPYVYFEIFLNEQITSTNWTLLSSSTTSFQVSRTFTLSSDYYNETSYSTKKLLNMDCVITFLAETSTSGYYVQNIPYNAVVSNIFFQSVSDSSGSITTNVYVAVTVSQVSGSVYGTTQGYISGGTYYVENTTYNTYHPLFIVVKGLVRAFR